ncbi:hypothetical protein X975_05727, partial [Stegodyphus mimosarum]
MEEPAEVDDGYDFDGDPPAQEEFTAEELELQPVKYECVKAFSFNISLPSYLRSGSSCRCPIAVAMFGYMTEIDKVEILMSQDIEAEVSHGAGADVLKYVRTQGQCTSRTAYRVSPHLFDAACGFNRTGCHLLMEDVFVTIWTGHFQTGDPIVWLPRFPDLFPLYLFFWGAMKGPLYDTLVYSEMDVVAWTSVAAAVIHAMPVNMSLEDITKLKKKRGGLRNSITRILEKIELELVKSSVNVNLIEEDLELLNDKFESLKMTDSEIESVLKPEELDEEIQTTENYRERIRLWKFRAKKTDSVFKPKLYC